MLATTYRTPKTLPRTPAAFNMVFINTSRPYEKTGRPNLDALLFTLHAYGATNIACQGDVITCAYSGERYTMRYRPLYAPVETSWKADNPMEALPVVSLCTDVLAGIGLIVRTKPRPQPVPYAARKAKRQGARQLLPVGERRADPAVAALQESAIPLAGQFMVS